MADSGATPPPKDVVTTRTPTPTSPPPDHTGSPPKASEVVDQEVSETAAAESNVEATIKATADGVPTETATESAEPVAVEKKQPESEVNQPASTEAAEPGNKPSTPLAEDAKPATPADAAVSENVNETSAPTPDKAAGSKPATPAVVSNITPSGAKDDASAVADGTPEKIADGDAPKTASPQPAGSKPVTPQLTGSKPPTPQPTGSKPATPLAAGSKPGTPQPASSKSALPQPAGTKSASPQPAGSKPGTPQPAGSKSGTPQPAGSKPGTPHPAGSKSASPQPAGTKSASPQPAGSKPGTPQPAGSKPGTPQPAGSKPDTPQPAGSKPDTPQPAGSKSVSPQPAGSKSASPQPTDSKPDPPQPTSSKPGTPQPASSKPGTPQPAGSKPGTPQPTGSKPASPQPGSPKGATPQPAGSKVVTPQPPVTNAATPQLAGSNAATPLAAASETGNNLSAPQSPKKQASELKESPPPPPTAEATGVRLPSTAASSESAIPASAPEKTSLSTLSEADEANILTGNALNMIWSFGLNKNIPMVNLSTDSRSIIMYACAHTGICYNFETNTQKLLQGHNNNISSTCVSEDKRWLATADKGPNNCMVIIWDTSTFFPVQTIFEAGAQGVVAMALTPDARYLATMSGDNPQVLCIWDWTVEGDTALCSATLDPSYGVQNFVLFNPDDTTQIVSNSESQVIFYAWGGGTIEYFCPPLTDDDFNKPVGKYTQSIFLENTNKCLTATSIGNLVVWASNKPLTKAVDNAPTPNKKALKLVKVQDRGINVLMVTDSQIVMGDMNGHVKLFDHNLNLVHWYQDLHIGPINAISFTHIEKWGVDRADTQDYPTDCSLVAKTLPMRNFVIGSTQSIYAQITPKGTDIEIILRNHDSPIHSIVAHPFEKKVFIGSYSGLLQIWNYELRETVASRRFDKGFLIQCIDIDPKGYFIAVGFTNGVVKILDALNLQDEDTDPFRYARDAITHIQFSPDSEYLATADGEFTTTLFKRQHGAEVQPWIYIGRHRAHYKEIKDISFGVELDSNKPRLLTLGKDRNLVEYDLENSRKDHLQLLSVDRIEQSAIPQCITWYPPLNKEHFLLTANDQFKFKLYNVTTKRCRKTVLGPTYGSPLQKICILPSANEDSKKRYLAYINNDKVGLHILPLDGNPHNSMALIAHPSGVSNMVSSFDGKYLFTAGGSDTTVHMWHINLNALEAQSKLGGEDLIPFYGLMEGGRDGELFAELEDYFYYAQLRNQGINTMMKRQVDVKIALSEVPYVMRAMGFYPSEQEVEDMLNEVKFSRYVETGGDVTDIDLGTFIRLYINHRPAFGLSHEKIGWCFEVLSSKLGDDASIKRGQFLDLLQRKGEHMTEYELSEYLTTLLGFNEEGGSCEQHIFDPTDAGNIIVNNLPVDMSTKSFTDDLLGFGFYQSPDILTLPQSDD